MAEAARVGAQLAEPGMSVSLLQAKHVNPDDLLESHGYLFVCPENLGSMTGMMKDFFDRCYYSVIDQINGRPYASLICAGSDGHGAARQIERIVTGWRLQAVAEPLIVCTQAQTVAEILAPKHIAPAAIAACQERGALLAAGLALGIL